MFYTGSLVDLTQHSFFRELFATRHRNSIVKLWAPHLSLKRNVNTKVTNPVETLNTKYPENFITILSLW